jgi:hypothetical protein
MQSDIKQSIHFFKKWRREGESMLDFLRNIRLYDESQYESYWGNAIDTYNSFLPPRGIPTGQKRNMKELTPREMIEPAKKKVKESNLPPDFDLNLEDDDDILDEFLKNNLE